MLQKPLGPDEIDYFPCRYGQSRNMFRGPRRRLAGGYVACIGGTETFGKGVAVPYPARIEALTGRTCVNFGCANAGVDAFLADHSVHEASLAAQITFLQLAGASNLSNRFYTVHVRRNDRFLRASNRLRTLYPDVDFTQAHFTHHLLHLLRDASEERFEVVVSELQSSWRARTLQLIAQLGRPLVLLCFSSRDDGGRLQPLLTFVTRAMVEALAGEDVRVEFVDLGLPSGFHSDVNTPLAFVPDAATHDIIAAQLAPLLLPET